MASRKMSPRFCRSPSCPRTCRARCAKCWMPASNNTSLVACIVAGLSTAILFICPADAQLDRLRKLNKEAESAKPAEAPMAKIPEGPFGMGIDGLQGLEDERPFHQVRLD